MIIQISRLRIIQYTVVLFVLLVFWFAAAFGVTCRVEDSVEGEVIVTFKFLVPMKPLASGRLVLYQTSDQAPLPFSGRWITANTLQIKISEPGYPRGQLYYYRFKAAPAMIWPFYVWAGGQFQPQVKLRLAGIAGDPVPSRGPVILQFNTDVEPGQIQQYIDLPLPGKLEPAPANPKAQGAVSDYSRWLFWPAKKLTNRQQYAIKLKKGLPGKNGTRLAEDIIVHFQTAPEFLIEQVLPRPGAASVWLTRDLIITTNQKLKSGRFIIPGLPGTTRVTNNQAKYIPERVMLPGQTYHAKVRLTAASNETLDYEFSFTTTNLGNSKWLELKLGASPTLWLMEGNKTLKKMTVAVKSRQLPTGTLYEQNRRTGAPGWLWLNADILLHHLPANMSDHHGSLGLPKSYSCIYLNEADLNLLLSTLPRGFMLICH
ncbi:hypothetical protein [Desulforamulus hydrothermalis]|uniref:Uncharacterized protein n=1 Tax=Desulforamulus hydrothermalis Lam5 = DSM 18033 TaxID=1121428 RepID=K8ELT3_9FIRM|nr:hypothetical protein [Desulforamulus hydrothermalis]CCO09431.1 conserved exported hypothetical protein [Desulforamulus hydrothermalis Lam5 = DSM 18033]SHH08295.1 hypothetical protein SAMN02745177_01374 [Desulforamulus hydrothermalis Lam5 = DSM 18033]